MAYAAVVSLAQTIDLILNNRPDIISPQLESQITSIHEYIIFLQIFLQDFPDKANSFEGSISMAAHVAEDIIEFLSTEQIHGSPYSLKPKFERQQPKGNWELELVAKEIESIAEEAMEIKNSITVKDARRGDSAAASSSSRGAPVHKNAMVGLEDDLMVTTSRLCGESPELEVVPIVGMGGIGKTTLAGNAYDHPLIVERFEIRAWVTVSHDYSAREIVSSLLVSTEELVAKKKGSTKEHHEDARRKKETKEELERKNLKGRRYLTVLDDIWSIHAWESLKMLFPDDGNGSRIMITTRLSDVASYAGFCSRLHEMRLMDEDQSWNLLRQEVFGQDPCPLELQHVGKMIARSCGGLPLAIVVISGLLSTVGRSRTAWENIAENVKSAISANEEQFDKILSLSYVHLPHHSGLCFSYLGGFPEDCKMRASNSSNYGRLKAF